MISWPATTSLTTTRTAALRHHAKTTTGVMRFLLTDAECEQVHRKLRDLQAKLGTTTATDTFVALVYRMHAALLPEEHDVA